MVILLIFESKVIFHKEIIHMKRKSKSLCLSAVLVAGIIVCLTSVAVAGALNGEPISSLDKTQVTDKSLVAAINTGYSLLYDAFSCTCSETGFSCGATATYNFPTNVTVYGVTLLNDDFYDNYSFGLSAGSGTYGTGFGRTFSPVLPSSTYVFSFISRLVNTSDQFVDIALTTISCNNGVASALGQGADYCIGDVCYVSCAPGTCPTSHCGINIPNSPIFTQVGQVMYSGCTPPCDPNFCEVYIPTNPF
jgi:hypothetical protein